jgi:hypothetical protein
LEQGCRSTHFFWDTDEVSYRDIGIRNGISPSVAEPAKINILAAGYQRASRKSAGRPSPPTKRTCGPGSWQIAAPDAGEVQCHHYVLQRGYCRRPGHGGPDTKIEHLVSITHLSFYRRVPRSREIEAYEKAQTANHPVATSSLRMPTIGTALSDPVSLYFVHRTARSRRCLKERPLNVK